MAAKELYGSREVVVTSDGRTGRREFLVPWDTRFDDVPQVGDPWPDDNILRVFEVRAIPFGKPTEDGEGYEEAKVLVRYSSSEYYRLRESFEAAISFDIGGLGSMWKAFKDADGNAVYNYQGIAMYLPTMTYCWESERADLSPAGIAPHLGKINRTAFRRFAKNTLLYLGATVSQRIMSTGEVAYRYSHRAMYRESGWNFFPVPGCPGLIDELDPPPYEETSFGSLT